MPVELRLELGAVVGLNDLHAKREAPHDLVEEADRGAWLQASNTFSTRIRVQSSMAVNW